MIALTLTENNCKLYIITDLGKEVLSLEITRIKRLYKNITQEVKKIMSDHRTIKHNFPISDFEEEQAFLTSHRSEGWKLLSIKGNKYTFQKCDREDVVYQIDFNPDERQKDEYIQLYSDFGWQFVTERDGRFYFCKSGRCEDENTIFSDRETKSVMCHKIIRRKLIGFIPISIISIIIIGLLIFFHNLVPFFLTATVSMVFIGWLIITLCTKKYIYGLLKIKEMLNDENSQI